MSDHVKKPDLMRRRTLQGLMLLLLFAIGSLGTLHAEESKQPPQPCWTRYGRLNCHISGR